MLKVSKSVTSEEAVVLRLEGRLIGPWVDEVRALCEHYLRRGVGLTLDLEDLSYMNREGVALVRRLCARRVALVNCSPFAAEQLREGNHG